MMTRSIVLAGLLLLALLPADGQEKKKSAEKKDPRVFLTVPLGAPPGKASRLTIRGANLDSATEVRIPGGQGSVKILSKGKAGVPDKNPDKVGDTQIEIELKLDSKIVGPSVDVVIVTPAGETKPHPILVETALPLIPEKEGNDGFRTAQPIARPVVIEGFINRPRDVDVFRFEGKKGEKIHAEVLASRHGSPLDPILTLYDARGSELAVNDDFVPEHHDAKIEAVLPADGIYYLGLIDANDTGSSLHVYRLVVK
jgi:hypothetical protein